MAADTLVKTDTEKGAALIRALDAESFPIVAALWMYYPDIGSWKLLLATPKARSPQEAYTEIRRIAERAGVDSPDLAQIKLAVPEDPTISGLSRVIRVAGVSGVRFSNNMINGIYVDDAYIYRTAA